jgi:hypothetical protein
MEASAFATLIGQAHFRSGLLLKRPTTRIIKKCGGQRGVSESAYMNMAEGPGLRPQGWPSTAPSEPEKVPYSTAPSGREKVPYSTAPSEPEKVPLGSLGDLNE